MKMRKKTLHVWRKKGMRKIKKGKNLINLLKGKICVLLLSVSCISIFFSNLTLAAVVTTSYDPWNDHQANGNGWFVEQGDASWCRITCSKIVLWDIVQKAVHRGVAAGHINIPELMNFFFHSHGIAAPIVPANAALHAPPAAGGLVNFDEVLMGSVFASGQGRVSIDTFFFVAFHPHQGAFINEINNFLNVNNGHINPACPGGGGCNCVMPLYISDALNAAGNEKNLLSFFDAMLRIPPPRATLTTTWNNFGAISRICQGMFFGNSEQAVDQEMNNICRVTGAPTLVDPANSAPSWAAIRNEIVNNQRMVIVTFVNPANPEEAHSCVAFAADNVAGNERIWLYNPWGNVIPVRGNNPGANHNMANGLGIASVDWDICQYTTFDY
jgi:hypothetical protein